VRYVDTNVLIRVVTGDDPIVAARAIEILQNGGQNEFCILDAILVELCFVLEFHAYKMARTDIVDAVETLIAIPQVYVTEVTHATIKLYREHPKLDYADCLLLSMGGKEGVVTFDVDLKKALFK
jgi:predicted nucleic-acid-binding protein